MLNMLEVQSCYQEDLNDDKISQLSKISTQSKRILPQIINKHVKQQHPLLIFFSDLFQKVIMFLKPFYSITGRQIFTNLSGTKYKKVGIILSNWNFQLNVQQIQKNLCQKKQFIRMSHYKLNLGNAKPQSIDFISQSNHDSLKMSIKQIQAQEETILNSKKYNQSLYFFIWGPITLILFAHLLHDKPFQRSTFDILAGGIIDIVLMLLISFSLFVYCKVIKSVVVSTYFQHLCFSSFNGIFTILYSLVCASAVDIVLIPLTLVYVAFCVFLHVNTYNKALKPNLIQLIFLIIIIIFFYSCAGLMFYQYYHLKQASSLLALNEESIEKKSKEQSHLHTHFSQRIFKHF